MKNKTNQKYLVIGLIVFILIIVISVFSGVDFFEENVDNSTTRII